MGVKKNYLILLALIPLTIGAICPTDNHIIDSHYLSYTYNLQYSPLLCPQIYLEKPALIGTEAECKREWDYYSNQLKKNPHDFEANAVLAIMLANGLGGQAIDLEQAKIHAEKTKRHYLIRDISEKIANPDSQKSITWCQAVAQITFEAAQCSYLQNENIANKFQQDMCSFAAKLPSKQQVAWQKVIDNLFEFLKLDHTTRSVSNQFYGGTYEPIRTAASIEIMLVFYLHATDYFLHHFPENLSVKKSAATLDKEMNGIYDIFLAMINPPAAKEKLIETQKAWRKYRHSLIDFAQWYYGKQYTRDHVRELLTLILPSVG